MALEREAPAAGPYVWSVLASLDPSRRAATLADIEKLRSAANDCCRDDDPCWLRRHERKHRLRRSLRFGCGA